MARVLIIEEQPGLSTAIGTVLRGGGYDVAFATGSTDAQARLTEWRPDLVVLGAPEQFEEWNRPALPLPPEQRRPSTGDPEQQALTHAHEVEILLDITSALNASITDSEMVRAVGERASALCQAEIAAVGLCRGADLLIFRRQQDGTWLEMLRPMLPVTSINSHVIATGTGYRSNDLAKDPYTSRAMDEKLGLRNQLTVPVHSGDGQVLGVISLYNKLDHRMFSIHDEHLLTAVATQTGIALDRFRTRSGLLEQIAAVEQSEKRLRALLQNGSDNVLIVDREGIVTWAGPSYQRLRGISAEQVVGRLCWERVHPNDIARATTFFQQVRGAPPATVHSTKLRTSDHTGVRWIEVTATNLLNEPAIQGIVSNVQDITERKLAEESLRESEARFRALVQNSSDLTSILDADGIITYMSPSARSMLGIDPAAMEGTAALSWIHPDDRAESERRLRERMAAIHRGASPQTFRIRRWDGSYSWAEGIATNLLHDPAVRGIVVNVRDVTERQALEEELLRQSFTDRLTGLPNRPVFADRLSHAVARGRRMGRALAVLLLDLDAFRVINDRLGQQAGDLMLAEAGRRLLGCLEAGDTIARVGGDEFAILLEEPDSVDAAILIARGMIGAMQQPFHLEGRDVTITASIGITVSVAGQERAEDLLSKADIALNHAKAESGSRWVVFDPMVHAQAMERMDLATELPGVVERQELVLHFQPEVKLGNGQIVGAEALVRWQHPVRGLIPPSVFIPIAEQSHAILTIGAWVLREACRAAAAWQAQQPGFVIGVNLSARQLQQPGLAEHVAVALRDSGLPASCLRLEVTESTAMKDIETAVLALRELRALGVQIALDDFGTGFSSLSYLRRLPADTLKIDRSFVAELASDPQAVAIVRSVTALAHEVGMEVTAEGIETKEQLASAVLLMCDRGQGYFFSRPIPEAQLSQMLGAGAQRRAVRTEVSVGRGRHPLIH